MADDLSLENASAPAESAPIDAPLADAAAPAGGGEGAPRKRSATVKGPSLDRPDSFGSLKNFAKAKAVDLVRKEDAGAADTAAGSPTGPRQQPAAANTNPGDPIGTLASFSNHLPPEQREAFAAAIAPVTEYVSQLQSWAGGIEQAAAQIQQQQEQLHRITNNPQFKQALEMVQQGGVQAAAGGAVRVMGPRGPVMLREEDCETDAERNLVRHARMQQEAYQRLQQEVEQIKGGLTARQQEERQRQVEEYRRQIPEAHQVLDEQFPTLVPRRQEWHQKAYELLAASAQSGGQINIKQALLEAARILTYDEARAVGGREALAKSRKAAQNFTYRDTAAAPDTLGPQSGESLSEFARRRKAALA